jgi:eukaryotic-like serine/threonine-protein kinase
MSKPPIAPAAADPSASSSPPIKSEPNSKTGDETCLKTLNAIEPPSMTGHARMGEFELMEKLGKGGVGIVYKSYHPRLQKTVAIKILKDAGELSIDDLNRFRGEALLAANLQHANIVQVFDILQESGNPFIVMEYVDGGSLEQKLDRKPQPPRQAVEWLLTVARAVAYAHEHQIIHRDLKPANILVTREGVLKITDFGLGKRLDSALNETRSGMIIGTPQYMAPEQAAGNTQQIGPSADIHALGAILYEMLTGRPPFQGVTLVEILEQVVNAEPPSPSRLVARIPRELSTICLKCLSKSPTRRYATATALAEDLRRWQDGEAIVARPTGRLERLNRSIRKHPLRSALAVAAALLVFLATTVYFLDVDRRTKEAERAREAENALRSEEDAKQSALLYAASHGALESVLDHINTDAKLRSAPGTRELRSLIRDRYEQLVVLLENDARPRDRMPLASAYDRLGKLYNRDDKTETALDKFERASRIYATMTSDNVSPDRTAEARHRLGLNLTEQGSLLYDLGRLPESENVYRRALQELTMARQAIDSLSTGADKQTSTDEVQKSIAEVDHGLGILLQSESKRKESLEEFKRALAIRADLVARNGDNVQFQRDLARNYGYQGDVELELGLVKEAEFSYWKSHEIRSRLYKPDSNSLDDVEAAFQYARSLSNFGNYHIRMRNFATAHHFFNQAEAIQKDVLRKEPDNNDYGSDLAGTQIRIVEAALLQGTLDEGATKTLQTATKALSDILVRDPKNISLSAALAESFLLGGVVEFDEPKTHQEAVTYLLDAIKYLEMPAKARPEAEYKYLLASAQALYSENLGRPFRTDSSWFKNLKEAIDLGYSRKDRSDVINDRAFRSFKDQPEFRKLLAPAAAEAPASPAPKEVTQAH